MAELKNIEYKHQVNAMRVGACLIRLLCTVRYWFVYCFLLLLRSTFVCYSVSMAVVNPFFREKSNKHCIRLYFLCVHSCARQSLIASGESIHFEKSKTMENHCISIQHSIQMCSQTQIISLHLMYYRICSIFKSKAKMLFVILRRFPCCLLPTEASYEF